MIVITTSYSSYDVYKLCRVVFALRCETMQKLPPTLYCIFAPTTQVTRTFSLLAL